MLLPESYWTEHVFLIVFKQLAAAGDGVLTKGQRQFCNMIDELT